MELDLVPIVNHNEEPELKILTFNTLFKLMGLRDQLRINHWQTLNYAQHKEIDKLIDKVSNFIDDLGEYASGLFGRPQVETLENQLFDSKLKDALQVLEEITILNTDLIMNYKMTEYEGANALLSEFDSKLKKYKYLLTLE